MYRELHYKYITVSPQSFEEMLNQLLTELTCTYTPIRLVFFATISSNKHYNECLALIQEKVRNMFGSQAPVISLVAQNTLNKVGLAVEVHEMEILSNESLQYKQQNNTPYIMLQDDSTKRLFLGGVISKDLYQPIAKQSEEVFDTIRTIMEAESMPIYSIVRQWNYIEKITEYNQGRQNYQAFNDARSVYYDQSTWEHGFPAATGIGTQWGGVMIDLNATLAYNDQTHITAIDNPLQVAAHAYSQTQLLGKADERLSHKTTPKFERAKQVLQGGNGVLYVSGTAAIRGELSLEQVGIEEQTRITIENINVLTGNQPLAVIRVYLKNTGELEGARSIIEQLYPNLPAIYLQADVCREELLIEIEGISIVTH
ncbi:MAG: hypothetical protein RSO15_01360 [Bacteroides sp.]|uniref:chorismate transformation enzyme, FkbO/Hyg5 family n=1 Tax=Bacteroides sp. TaxID=29523 RepID=UPI002FC8A760